MQRRIMCVWTIYLIALMMDGCEGITEGGRDDAKRLVTFGYFAGQAGGFSLSVVMTNDAYGV